MTTRGHPKGFLEQKELLDESGIERVLETIADRIIQGNPGAHEILVVGIHTGGAHLAVRLSKILSSHALVVEQGMIDITLYRDDITGGLPRPEVGPTRLPSSLAGRTIVLVDDVLYTGRTVRAALDELIDYGRPQCVQLAVLIDRGHRELPIQADFVGLEVETSPHQSVRVHLTESGAPLDRVVLYEVKTDP